MKKEKIAASADKKQKKKLRITLPGLYLFCGIFIIAATVPSLFISKINSVIAALLLSGAALIFAAWLYRFRGRSKLLKVCLKLFGAGVVCTIALCAAISAMIVHSAFSTPPPSGCTVIVMGCGIRDDRPSALLRGRLDAAYDYLAQSPDSACVVSGGLGEGKSHTESYVMKKYLVERGISPERIFEEPHAVDSIENIAFSSAIIKSRSLSEQVAVASDIYHIYRSKENLKSQGYAEVYALPAMTRTSFTPVYWLREIIAIVWHRLFD